MYSGFKKKTVQLTCGFNIVQLFQWITSAILSLTVNLHKHMQMFNLLKGKHSIDSFTWIVYLQVMTGRDELEGASTVTLVTSCETYTMVGREREREKEKVYVIV